MANSYGGSWQYANSTNTNTSYRVTGLHVEQGTMKPHELQGLLRHPHIDAYETEREWLDRRVEEICREGRITR